MRMQFVVAVSENDVIGRRNQLPWRLSADLRRFKTLTLGKPILMGRRTYESIGHALPGRLNLVLSRSSGFAPGDCTVVPTLEAARAAGMSSARAVNAADMADAVARARAMARAGTVVLLSPAAPSFDHYRDFEERGASFCAAACSVIVGEVS